MLRWLLLLALLLPPCVLPRPGHLLPSLYQDRAFFERALSRAEPIPPQHPPTGLIVPHHLLVHPLMASALAGVASPAWRHVLLLAPDHFRRSRTPISVVDADFQTPLGPVFSDRDWVQRLARVPGATASDLFAREHGFQSLLPFIRKACPRARICAVALRVDARRDQLDALVEAVKPLLGPDTLVVQSTDFSHYLPLAQADQRDAESLEVLRFGHPSRAFRLQQPANIDSVAALYVQMRLQREVFQSEPVVLAQDNSQHHAKEPVLRTTSYVVARYERRPPELILAGDVMPGRAVAAVERPWQHLQPLFQAAGAVLANLEGPLVEAPTRTGALCFAFPGATAGKLQAAGITHLGLANNHLLDQGPEGLEETRSHLRRVRLRPVGDPRWDTPVTPVRLQLGARAVHLFALHAATEHWPLKAWSSALARSRDLDPEALRLVFLHAGQEYQPVSAERVRALAHALVASGAGLVVGHHPHVVQEVERHRGIWIFYSLGNLLFDQWSREATRNGLMLRLQNDRVTLLPLLGGRGQPRLASEADRAKALETLARRSDPVLREAIRSGLLESLGSDPSPGQGRTR